MWGVRPNTVARTGRSRSPPVGGHPQPFAGRPRQESVGEQRRGPREAGAWTVEQAVARTPTSGTSWRCRPGRCWVWHARPRTPRRLGPDPGDARPARGAVAPDADRGAGGVRPHGDDASQHRPDPPAGGASCRCSGTRPRRRRSRSSARSTPGWWRHWRRSHRDSALHSPCATSRTSTCAGSPSGWAARRNGEEPAVPRDRAAAGARPRARPAATTTGEAGR